MEQQLVYENRRMDSAFWIISRQWRSKGKCIWVVIKLHVDGWSEGRDFVSQIWMVWSFLNTEEDWIKYSLFLPRLWKDLAGEGVCRQLHFPITTSNLYVGWWLVLSDRDIDATSATMELIELFINFNYFYNLIWFVLFGLV